MMVMMSFHPMNFKTVRRFLAGTLLIVTLVCLPLLGADKQRPIDITNFSRLKSYIRKEVKRREVEQSLRSFIRQTHPSRMVGSSGHNKAIPHLKEQIIKRGANSSLARKISMEVQTFTPDVKWASGIYLDDFEQKIKPNYSSNHPEYQKWNRFTRQRVELLEKLAKLRGANLVWEKQGADSSNKVIILGAHYDSLVSDPNTLETLPGAQMPGADDNASGVTVLLALIKVLAPLKVKHTVRVIFFDFQELGFLGSKAYVTLNQKQLKKESIYGMINLEMLGHDTVVEDTSKQSGNMRTYIRKTGSGDGFKRDRVLANTILDAGARLGSRVNFDLIPNGFDSSDHLPFWQAGIPAMMMTQNWEEDFNHRGFNSSNDFSETINFVTLHHSAQFIAAGVLSWALGL
jgi:hypothetical protein